MSEKQQRNRFPKEVHFNQDVWVVQADMNTEYCKDYLEILRRFKYADGMRDNSICESKGIPDAEVLIDQLRKEEMTYACIGWLIYCPGFVNAAEMKGMKPREYADYLYDLCNSVNFELGYRAAWMEAYGEVTIGVVWPRDKVFTKREALEYFRDWFTTGLSCSHQWHQRVDREVNSFYSHAKSHNADLRKLPVYYTDSTVYALQEAFRFGFPLVCYESQCATMESTQLGIAFVRGGARMYDAWWGVDFSPWSKGLQAPGIETDSVGNWRQGVTSDFQYRTWLATYMSGCNTILHEDSYCLFYAKPNEKIMIPSDLGHQAMKFYAITQSRISDRGKPVVPFAIMLEEAHGYGTECQLYWEDEQSDKIGVTGSDDADIPFYLWHAKVKPVRGDYALSRLIRKTLWPLPDGVWKDIGAGEWPDRLKKNLDWENAPDLQDLYVGNCDVRECSRFASNSRWADCFDFVMETAPAEKLAEHYKVVVLGGAIQADGKAMKTLLQFMQAGGIVVCSVDQISPSARQELSLDVSAEPSEESDGEETLLLYSADSDDFQVIRSSDSGKPLVIKSSIGQGEIYVMLFANGMTVNGTKMSRHFEEIIGELYNDIVGVTHDGPPCQVLVNERKEDTVVTLINHTGNDWRGNVNVARNGKPRIEQVRELIADESYPQHLVESKDKYVSVNLRVPAFGVRVVGFGKTRERSSEINLRPLNKCNEREKQLEKIRSRGAKSLLGVIDS